VPVQEQRQVLVSLVFLYSKRNGIIELERTRCSLLLVVKCQTKRRIKKEEEEEEEETNFWIVSDNTRTCPYKGTKIARRTNFSDYNRRKW